MGISEALGALGSAYEAGKKVMAALAEAGKADLRLQVGELTSTLLDARLALAEAKQALEDKDKEIARLKDSFAFRATTVLSNGWRYLATVDGKPKGRPFCPRCDNVDARLMMLQPSTRGGLSLAFCPGCKTEYARIETWLREEFDPERSMETE